MGRSADFNGIDAAVDLLAQEYVKLRGQLRGLLSPSAGSAKKPGRKKPRRPVHQKRRK